MRAPLQEKFQISVPDRKEDGESWTSFESARSSQADVPRSDGNKVNSNPDGKFNYLPPGMDISNQCSVEINSMPLSLAGESDVSMDTNPKALASGFTKREMKGIDDQYTGEHVDLFYGDAGGFAERNNYLDRE